MPVTESQFAATNEGSESKCKDAHWVFESHVGGDLPRGIARIAVKKRGADINTHAGPSGSTYALATRKADGSLLPWDEIGANIQGFIKHARANDRTKFRFTVAADKKSKDEHEKFADLLRNVPANCELTGRHLEILERLNAVRIILLDANIRVNETDRKHILDQYFAANAGLWNADTIELVSLGSAQSLVANDKYARERGYKHRIFSVDSDLYGSYTDLVREHLSVAYATKLVCLNDPTGTSTGNQVGALNLAGCAGLQIDEMLIQ